jgi:NADPH:quinone reductase-like Zn-dependent oxidoreductase
MPSEDEAKKHGVRAASVQTMFTGEQLREIAGLIESGKVKPVLGPVFPLAEAAKAHALSESRHGQGRIVLHVAD